MKSLKLFIIIRIKITDMEIKNIQYIKYIKGRIWLYCILRINKLYPREIFHSISLIFYFKKLGRL